jgi:AcrR family transcriptional regulator
MMMSAVTETLPAGDHASVAARDRLMRGLRVSIKHRGYRDTTISDIVACARTSRRTFYEVFASKDDCFLALVEEMNHGMRELIARALDPEAPWDVQVRAGVTAWVEALAAEPELSVSWIRELPLLGEPARQAQRAAMQSFGELLMAITDTPQMRKDGVTPVTMATATILLGGLGELAAIAAEDGLAIQTIIDPAVDAALALLGPRGL